MDTGRLQAMQGAWVRPERAQISNEKNPAAVRFASVRRNAMLLCLCPHAFGILQLLTAYQHSLGGILAPPKMAELLKSSKVGLCRCLVAIPIEPAESVPLTPPSAATALSPPTDVWRLREEIRAPEPRAGVQDDVHSVLPASRHHQSPGESGQGGGSAGSGGTLLSWSPPIPSSCFH